MLTQLNQLTRRFYTTIIHLFFPDECIICEKETQNHDVFICHLCEQELEYTKMENCDSDQKTKKIFWGRIPIEEAFSLLYFSKGNFTQKILHAIKYQNQKKLTIEMGKRIGIKLKDKSFIKDIDFLIPVPIHNKRKFERGYNQSELLCSGISNSLNIKINTKLVLKKSNNKSQTKLNKFLRWENAQNLFEVSKEINNIKNMHIAIVDDVITTGSTIEALSKEILKINPSIKISVISLALAT